MPPPAAACSHLCLAAASSFVCTRCWCQLDCVGAFLDSSAPSLLPPAEPPKPFAYCELPGRRASCFWSTSCVSKGLINPNYISSSLQPPICLSAFLSLPLHCFLLQNLLGNALPGNLPGDAVFNCTYSLCSY